MGTTSPENEARIAEMRRMLGSAPPHYAEWYYDRTVAFKKVAARAAAVVTAKAPRPAEIERAWRDLRREYE